MKKSLLIVMTVAILGGLGLYFSKNNDQPAMADNTPTTVQSASTTSSDSQTQSTDSTATPAANYKDGTYVGSDASTIYGTVQVSAIISSGKITDIQFIKMPDDQENSKVVTAMAEPKLKSAALSAQTAKIDFVTGATQTSEGFEQSLQNALNQAAQS